MNRLTISALAVAISLASSAEAAVEDLRDSQTYTGTDVTTAAPSETTMETNSSAMRESQTYSGTSAEGPANADAMPTTLNVRY